jgi:hypothetical protein
MHPLLAAHHRLQELQAIEPRQWGLYWPMWQRMMDEEREFVRDLESVTPLYRHGETVYSFIL